MSKFLTKHKLENAKDNLKSNNNDKMHMSTQ